MVDKIEPINKSRLIDRIRFGERYLRDYIDTITNKTARRKKQKNGPKEPQNKDSRSSAYDNLSVPQEPEHSLDEEV